MPPRRQVLNMIWTILVCVPIVQSKFTIQSKTNSAAYVVSTKVSEAVKVFNSSLLQCSTVSNFTNVGCFNNDKCHLIPPEVLEYSDIRTTSSSDTMSCFFDTPCSFDGKLVPNGINFTDSQNKLRNCLEGTAIRLTCKFKNSFSFL